MLTLRLSVDSERAGQVSAALQQAEGVRRLVRGSTESASEEVVLSADITPSGADEVMSILGDLQVDEDDYLLARLEVVAPSPAGRRWRDETSSFAWVEVMGEARANARPLARYLTLMGVAGVIAALGVITSNTILIVGAMAVSPDLLPICSTCVGIVGGRWRLARLAFVTLTIGLRWSVAAAAG